MMSFAARMGKVAVSVAAVWVLAVSAGCQTTPASAPATGGDTVVHVKKISFVAEPRGTVVKIFSSRKLDYTSYKLADPLRLAIEMPNVTLDFEPKRIMVEDEIVSAIGVVRFTKVNSARVELELLSDAQFKLAQKTDYLEVLLTQGGTPLPAARNQATASAGLQPENVNEKVEALSAETERLKAESLEARKAALQLEEQNAELKRQLKESRKQLEEANSLSKTMQARVAFVEQQLADLDAKVGTGGGGISAEGPALELATVPAPLPAPGMDAGSTSAEPAEQTAALAVNQTVAAWLKAWNRKDLEAYGAYYAPDFRAKDMDLAQWIEDKKVKFSTSKSIKVKAKKMKMTMNPDGTATLLFEQQYKTGRFRDKGLKQLVLAERSGKWLITSEEWSPLTE